MFTGTAPSKTFIPESLRDATCEMETLDGSPGRDRQTHIDAATFQASRQVDSLIDIEMAINGLADRLYGERPPMKGDGSNAVEAHMEGAAGRLTRTLDATDRVIDGIRSALARLQDLA